MEEKTKYESDPVKINEGCHLRAHASGQKL